MNKVGSIVEVNAEKFLGLGPLAPIKPRICKDLSPQKFPLRIKLSSYDVRGSGMCGICVLGLGLCDCIAGPVLACDRRK